MRPAGWQGLQQIPGITHSLISKQRSSTSGLMIAKESERSYDRFRDRIMFPIRNIQGTNHRLRWPHFRQWPTEISELT